MSDSASELLATELEWIPHTNVGELHFSTYSYPEILGWNWAKISEEEPSRFRVFLWAPLHLLLADARMFGISGSWALFTEVRSLARARVICESWAGSVKEMLMNEETAPSWANRGVSEEGVEYYWFRNGFDAKDMRGYALLAHYPNDDWDVVSYNPVINPTGAWRTKLPRGLTLEEAKALATFEYRTGGEYVHNS